MIQKNPKMNSKLIFRQVQKGDLEKGAFEERVSDPED